MQTRNRWVNLRLLLPAFPLNDQVESCLWFTCEPVRRLCVDPLRAVLARRAVLRWILINTAGVTSWSHMPNVLVKRTANELPSEASADAFFSFTFDTAPRSNADVAAAGAGAGGTGGPGAFGCLTGPT